MTDIIERPENNLANPEDVLSFLDTQADKQFEPGFAMVKISRDAPEFVCPSWGKSDEMIGIILAIESIRTLWPKGSDENIGIMETWAQKRPLCQSRGENSFMGKGELVKPIDEESPTLIKEFLAPIMEADNLCKNCPWSQFGSDGKGQACKEGRRFLIWNPESDMSAVFSITPTSLKAWGGYRAGLPGQHFSRIITRFTLTEKERGSYRWKEVIFTNKGNVTNQIIAPLAETVPYKGEYVHRARALVAEFMQLELEKDEVYPDNGSDKTDTQETVNENVAEKQEPDNSPFNDNSSVSDDF